MFALQLFFVGVVLVFIFIFNGLVMRRNQLDRLATMIAFLLERRRELAGKMLSELVVPEFDTLAGALSFDHELAVRLENTEIEDASVFADFQSCNSMLQDKLQEYRQGAEAYNKALLAPPVCWVARPFKFLPRELF